MQRYDWVGFDIPNRKFIRSSSCDESIRFEYEDSSALQLLLSADEYGKPEDVQAGLQGMVDLFQSTSALVELCILSKDISLLESNPLGPVCVQTHPLAMYLVAEMDSRRAFELHSRASELGYAPSLHALGVMYEFGGAAVCVERDLVAAYRAYTAAAEAGYVPAMLNLGKLYLTGELLGHTTPESGKASYWLRQAAQGGNREAMLLEQRMKRNTPSVQEEQS